MKKFIIIVYLSSFLKLQDAKADLLGGDVAVLIQILAQAIQEYEQLVNLLQTTKDNRDILKSVNAGLDNAIRLLQSLPIEDEKILGNLKNFQEAFQKIQFLYGEIPKGKYTEAFRLHDETIAESIKVINASKEYAQKQEDNANRLNNEASLASPKGAAKLNVQTNAAILHSLNQLLRVNGQMLKMQSEILAMENKSGKESYAHFQKVNLDIRRNYIGFSGDFETPKFKTDD